MRPSLRVCSFARATIVDRYRRAARGREPGRPRPQAPYVRRVVSPGVTVDARRFTAHTDDSWGRHRQCPAQTAEELAGGTGSLGGAYPDRTVGSFCPSAPPLLDSIRLAMPADAPLSLDNDAVYAQTAYLLGWARGPGSISFDSADRRYPLPLPPHTKSPSWGRLDRSVSL